MSYPGENPGHGNQSEINGYGINQSSRVTYSAEVSAELTAILNSRAADAWQSASATAWRERVGRVFPMIDSSAQVAQGWADAVQKYRSALESMTAQADDANRKIHTGRSMITAYAQMPIEITGTAEYQRRAQEYEQDIGDGHQTLQYLEGLRYGDDATCVYALNSRGATGSFSDWHALQFIYGDAKSVADIRSTRIALADEFSLLGDKVIGNHASDEEIAALAKFLATSAADPALAGEFWTRYTGEESAWMLSSGVENQLRGGQYGLDYYVTDLGTDFAQALRASLAAGSQRWSQETAERFALQMYNRDGGLPKAGQPLSFVTEIGYLFDDADENPMGVRFTVAMADLFDSAERGPQGDVGGYGRAFDWHRSREWSGDEPGIGTNLLWLAEGDGDRGKDSMAIDDPLSRVLDTLAVYPDSAWDWLSADGSTLPDGQPATASDKVDFYSSRDWTNDGWDGFGSLWESSLRADGGLMDGPPNTATWDAQCDVAARVINGLAEGLSGMRPGDLPAEGAEAIGTSLAHLMPMISAALWSQPTTVRDGLLLDPERMITGCEGTVNIPYFDKELLGQLVGQVGSTESGFAILRVAITETQNRVLAVAEADGTGLEWHLALDKVYKLEGHFDGAVGGASVVQGMFDDAEVKAKIAVISDLVGLLPGAKIEGVGGEIVGLVDGEARSGIVGWYESKVLINEDLAMGLLDSDVLLGRELLDGQVDKLIASGSSLRLVDELKSETEDAWFDSFGTSYEDVYYRPAWGAING